MFSILTFILHAVNCEAIKVEENQNYLAQPPFWHSDFRAWLKEFTSLGGPFQEQGHFAVALYCDC